MRCFKYPDAESDANFYTTEITICFRDFSFCIGSDVLRLVPSEFWWAVSSKFDTQFAAPQVTQVRRDRVPGLSEKLMLDRIIRGF